MSRLTDQTDAVRQRRIAVVTGTRAEFGLLRPIMRRIHDNPALELQLIATGMHLSPEFGRTTGEIRASGLPIADEIEILVSSDTGVGTAKSIGLAISGLADSFRRLAPDLVLVLGDRFEIFAAGAAATAMGIPLAHLCGGEQTDGAVDQVWRACLTKMAHLHLVAAEQFGVVVRGMGEEARRVRVVGSPGLENLLQAPPVDRVALGASIGIELRAPVVSVSFHPVTRPIAGEGTPEEQVDELLAALASVPATYVITFANADAGGRVINRRLSEFAAEHTNAVAVPSLGVDRYIALLSLADAAVGNSSSGLIETPSFELPVVNIGTRQGGRPRAANVIDVPPTTSAIAHGLRRALDPTFRAGLRGVVNPYGDGQTSGRVIAAIHEWLANPDLLVKR